MLTAMLPLLALTSVRDVPVSSGDAAALRSAVESAGPGVRIRLAAGRYRLDRPLRIEASGREGAWIEIVGPESGEAVIDGSGWVPKTPGEIHSGLVEIQKQSHIRLKRLAVIESHGFGIRAHDGSSFIDIQDCRIDHTFQPGIGLWNSADIRVVGNEVTRANTQTKRLFGSRSQEAPHEAISIAGIDRFEAAWNRVHHCQKEGIDVKEISRNGVVHHNWVHNLDRQGLYADAWFGVLRDVRFLNNVVHDCEWGLVISAEGKDAELIGVEAEGNLIYRNRASGIYFGTWGGNGPRSRIVIRRNTLVGNGTRTHWAGPTGNIDLRATNARDVLVERNLIIAGGAYQMATGWTDVERAERRIVLRDNFFDSVTTPNLDGLEMGPYGRPVPTFGETPSSGEVRFEGDAFGDFSFSPESPAKPAGYGAHGLRPAINSPLKGFEPYRPDPRGLHPFLVRQMESVAP